MVFARLEKSTSACKEVDIAGLKLDEETKSQLLLQLQEQKGKAFKIPAFRSKLYAWLPFTFHSLCVTLYK